MSDWNLAACFAAALQAKLTGKLQKAVNWNDRMSEQDWRRAMDQVVNKVGLETAWDAIMTDIVKQREAEHAGVGHAMANFIVHYALKMSAQDIEKTKAGLLAALPHGYREGPGGKGFVQRYESVATQLGMGPKG